MTLKKAFFIIGWATAVQEDAGWMADEWPETRDIAVTPFPAAARLRKIGHIQLFSH